MDKLEKIFEMQAQLDNFLIQSRNIPDYTTEEWLQKQTIAMISELSELMNEVNFKWWKNPKELDSSAIKEELVDILHFFVGMCLKSGMTADEMFDIYISKNKENYDRQLGLSEKQGYTKQ